MIDQKSFLEERNRQLEDRLKIRSDKLESTDETKTQYQSELKAAKITIKGDLNTIMLTPSLIWVLISPSGTRASFMARLWTHIMGKVKVLAI